MMIISAAEKLGIHVDYVYARRCGATHGEAMQLVELGVSSAYYGIARRHGATHQEAMEIWSQISVPWCYVDMERALQTLRQEER